MSNWPQSGFAYNQITYIAAGAFVNVPKLSSMYVLQILTVQSVYNVIKWTLPRENFTDWVLMINIGFMHAPMYLLRYLRIC